jgi:hypothetical protein
VQSRLEAAAIKCVRLYELSFDATIIKLCFLAGLVLPISDNRRTCWLVPRRLFNGVARGSDCIDSGCEGPAV